MLALAGRIPFDTTFLLTSASGRCPDLGMTLGRALIGQLTPVLTFPGREGTLQMMTCPKTPQNRRPAKAPGEVFQGVEKPHCLMRGLLRCHCRAPLPWPVTARARGLWMVEQWQQGLQAAKAQRAPLPSTTPTMTSNSPTQRSTFRTSAGPSATSTSPCWRGPPPPHSTGFPHSWETCRLLTTTTCTSNLHLSSNSSSSRPNSHSRSSRKHPRRAPQL